MRIITKASLSFLLSAQLALFPLGTVTAQWNDDNSYFYNYNNSHLNDFQLNPNNRLDLNVYRPNPQFPSFEIRTPMAPDLTINSWTMKLPEINVSDIGDSVWSYQKVDDHYNTDLKAFDHYSADINFKFGETAAEHSVGMDLGNMKFGKGHFTPESFTRTYKDELGNTLVHERTNQTGQMNDSYNRFVQFNQREGQPANNKMVLDPNPLSLRSPVDPPMETISGFSEKWQMSIADDSGVRRNSTLILQIDSIKNESNLHRFVSEYSGTLKDGRQNLSFKVNSPHDDNGSLQSLALEISGKGAPTATIKWKPVAGQDATAAFALLRDNLPTPLFVGPRSNFRLNGVDMLESPLHVTPKGDLSSKQLGTAHDLANLVGKENLGIEVSFSPPDANTPTAGFSLGNSLRNLWYMVTGQWSDVKGMRQQLTSMQNHDPGKFVLAAGFSDPGFMSLKDLRSAIVNSSTTLPNKENKDDLSAFSKKTPFGAFDIAMAAIKSPFKIVGAVIGAVTDLPGVKQVLIGTRIVVGTAIGVLTGDIFDRSIPIIFDAKGPAVVTINGIFNSGEQAQEINRIVKGYFGVKDATVIRNNTHWFGLGDIIQILAHEYLGAIDKPSLDAAKAIRAGIRDKGEVFVVAHSQGAAIFKQALSLLSTDERAHIHYLGVGPEWIIDAKTEGLASADNIENKGDFVPNLGNRDKLLTNLIFPSNWGRTRQEIQPQETGAKWGAAHQFVYYEQAVKNWTEKWRSQWPYGTLQPAY